MHTLTAATAALAPAAVSTDGFSTTKLLAIIGAALVIVTAWVAVIVISRHGTNGDDKKASRSGTVVLIGLGLFAVAGVIVPIVIWIQNTVQFAIK